MGLTFVRSGTIYLSQGIVWNVGSTEFNWSASADSSIGWSYFLSFTERETYVSERGNRWHGFPLRCLAS